MSNPEGKLFICARLAADENFMSKYPRKWAENFRFLRRVAKEATGGLVWTIYVTGVTSRGVWCHGTLKYSPHNSGEYEPIYTSYSLFYRHKQKPTELNARDTNWRLSWGDAYSRRIARKYDLETGLDDIIMNAMNKVRAMEAREALNA